MLWWIRSYVLVYHRMALRFKDLRGTFFLDVALDMQNPLTQDGKFLDDTHNSFREAKNKFLELRKLINTARLL